ncbi:nucleoporin GLE1-like, partial [Onychomys torridus]|uniref:nucleoporin GLE1-like n=1 Tax=Onychomys torridus TaxID=38674 RepID=UPI00167F3697
MNLASKLNAESRAINKPEEAFSLVTRRVSKEPPPTPTCLTKRQVKQKVESLTTQLQVMTAQRNDLRDRLILVTEGSLDKSDLQSRLLLEQRQQKKKVDLLRQEKENLQEEWLRLKKHLSELKVLCKDQEETSDLENQQQQEQQRLEERLQSLLKQREMVTQQKHLAMKLQHHLTVSQM